jgi:hypothetical protein
MASRQQSDDPSAADLHVCDAGLTRAFELLGKRWNGVILGTLKTGRRWADNPAGDRVPPTRRELRAVGRRLRAAPGAGPTGGLGIAEPATPAPAGQPLRLLSTLVSSIFQLPWSDTS